MGLLTNVNKLLSLSLLLTVFFSPFGLYSGKNLERKRDSFPDYQAGSYDDLLDGLLSPKDVVVENHDVVHHNVVHHDLDDHVVVKEPVVQPVIKHPVPIEVEKPVVVKEPVPVEVEKQVVVKEPYPVEIEKPVIIKEPVPEKVPVPYPVAEPVPQPVPVPEPEPIPYPVPVEKIEKVPYPVIETEKVPVPVPVPVETRNWWWYEIILIIGLLVLALLAYLMYRYCKNNEEVMTVQHVPVVRVTKRRDAKNQGMQVIESGVPPSGIGLTPAGVTPNQNQMLAADYY